MSKLPQPRYEFIVDKAVQVPMRDGTLLAADVYRPKAEGRFPAIVERTPYNREESVILRTQTPQFMAARGFVFVVQDVRGRWGSDGLWYPFIDDGWGENQDGYDTIQWVAEQPWCSGKVATAGGSYSGQTQMLLAPTRPPALACSFIREAASDLASQWGYRGGAFEWGFNLEWCTRHAAISMRKQTDLLLKSVPDPTRFDGLPLASGARFADPLRWLHDLVEHSDDGPFWHPANFEQHYHEIDAPIYHMAGWFDIFLDGSLRNFMGIQKHGRSKATRNRQKLIVGPWSHGPTVNDPAFARHVGDMDFGPNATFDYNHELLRWCDRWLHDSDGDGIGDEPAVRYFLMAANEWRTADTWPPPGVQTQSWFLRAGPSGSATSLNDGSLSLDRPGKEKADKYRYDPVDPVPTVGGNTLYSGAFKKSAGGEENPDFAITAGPRDQRPIEPRCLTYTSEPLEHDVDVVGPVSLTLFASSNCVDTDFVARLSDVFPDGRSIGVVDGILRARYRKSRTRPKLLKPKKVYRFDIDLWPTAWRFAAGHRLRVAVTSSSFPRFDRNLNTGEHPARAKTMKVATNVVYHDKRFASCLELPVME